MAARRYASPAAFRRTLTDRLKGVAQDSEVGVRASIDVDVFRAAALEIAERDLREAAALDLGDWFAFETGPAQEAGDGTAGLRVPIRALIGPTDWVRFHVDLVGNEVTMTGTPEQMPALARVTMPDVEQRGYRVYPLVDHVADKIAATFDRYGRFREPQIHRAARRVRGPRLRGVEARV